MNDDSRTSRGDDDLPPSPKRGLLGKFTRAKVRHALLTLAADRITRGSLSRRHRAQAVEIRELELRLPRWPRELDGMRIAHVSDFHVGHLMSVERATDVVDRVRSLRPDLLACTGDVVDLDMDCGVEAVFEAMAEVRAALGAWLVLGNHDHLDDGKRLARLARTKGVRTLNDETVTLDGGLRLGGVDWGRSIRECSTRVGRAWRDGAGIDLLLSHNPKSFVAAARLGVPLTLAGHTHGGQVNLRKKSDDISFRRRLRAGLYRRDEATLFVTVGLGAWFPLRVNCPPEVVLLTARAG